MNSYKVSFRQKSTGNSSTIELFSHYTCIYGKNSGEGKTEFFSMIEDGISDDSIEIVADLPFTVATPATLNTILNVPERIIIMIDESSALPEKLIKRVNKSHHLFICISRAMPLRMEYPLKGIYYLVRENGWFSFKRPLA